MFLAAAPYFAGRFESSKWISTNFQSSIISISTVTNLSSTLLLANMQAGASYPRRIASALLIDIVVFTILALSTIWFTSVSAAVYLGFVLSTVFVTSTATGLLQNGTFAFAASFGHPSYTQAVMTGQAIAGVLPSIAQIISVLAVPEKTTFSGSSNYEGEEGEGGGTVPELQATSALIYFLTATVIALITLVAFVPLVRRHADLNRQLSRSITDLTTHRPSVDLSRSLTSLTQLPDPSSGHRKTISLPQLYRKLPFYSSAIFLVFAITMFFPVYTAKIVSVRDPATSPRLLHPAAFIPLAFLFWNSGDLLGRLATLLPFRISHRPIVLFICSILRIAYIPLYLLCNVVSSEGTTGGVVVKSDLFYLVVVQFGFGLTNGYIASSAMMGASQVVGEEEREATGGFMGFNLVAGLTVGSLLSFVAA